MSVKPLQTENKFTSIEQKNEYTRALSSTGKMVELGCHKTVL